MDTDVLDVSATTMRRKKSASDLLCAWGTLVRTTPHIISPTSSSDVVDGVLPSDVFVAQHGTE